MQKYECAGTGHGKHAGLFEVDCFALELKEVHILSRLTALPSAFSGQHIPQLAHGNPDTAQIPKIRTYWTCIERAALSLAPKEAQRSERQQAWGTSLGVAATHPPKYAQMSTGSAAKKHRERANNAVLPVGAVLAAPCTVTGGGKENTLCAIANVWVLRVTPMTTVSEWPQTISQDGFFLPFFPCKSQSEETNWERTAGKSM